MQTTTTKMAAFVVLFLLPLFSLHAFSAEEKSPVTEVIPASFSSEMNAILVQPNWQLPDVFLQISAESGTTCDISRLRARIHAMEKAVTERVDPAKPIASVVDSLNRVFFNDLGFFPVTGRSARYLYAQHILSSRKGYCLSLGVLYIHLARKAGVQAFGVELPGHFFVRIRQKDESRNLELLSLGEVKTDAYYRKQYSLTDEICRNAGYMSDLSDRDIVANLYNNDAQTRLLQKDFSGAMRSCNAALSLKKNHAGAWLNRGLIFLYQKKPEEAKLSLQRCLALCPLFHEAKRILLHLKKAASAQTESMQKKNTGDISVPDAGHSLPHSP